MESPYANAVDINSAKIAIEIVELEHEIEDARQLNHLQDVEELRARRDALRKKIRPDV